MHYANGHYEEAIAAFQKAIELNPNDAYAHNNIAGTYQKLKKIDLAIYHYQERARLQPDTMPYCIC